jgi:hypothetical protein
MSITSTDSLPSRRPYVPYEKQLMNDNLHVCTVHQQYQSTFYYSTLMHTIIKSRNIKTIKIPTVAPTCFGSRRNHLQGASFVLS